MKRAILALLILLNFLLIPSIVSAEGNQSKGSCEPVFNTGVEEKMKEYKEEDASLPESYAIDYITSFVNIAGINSMANLIFGNPYCIWSSEEKVLIHGIFTSDEQTKIIEPMIKLVKSIFVSILVLSMMFSGIKVGFSGLTGKSRAEFWEDVKMWFMVTIFLFSYDFLIEQLFVLNTAVINSFKSLMDSNGLDYKTVSLMTANSKFAFTDIVVFLAEWLLALYMNFIYIFRKVVILILMILGPVAGISLLFTQTRTFFSTWIKELCGLIFLQSFHSFILTIFIFFSTLLSGINGTMFKMALLVMFIPLTGMLMSWMKLSETSSNLDKFGMMGVKSVAAAANVTRFAAAKSPIGKKIPDFAKQNNTRISELAQGKHSKVWIAMKSGAGMSGAILGGTAGLVLGPQGVMLGAMAGKGITAGFLQGSRNLSAFGVNTFKNFKDIKNSGGFKQSFKDIGKRREFFGNMGESAGALIGLGGLGRSAGHALSGVSRQRLLNSSEPGGFGGMNLQKLSETHADQNVKWIQDQKGSAFFLDKGNDNLERISPWGAADPSLGAGIQREVDYKFGNPLQSLGYSPNGTYSVPQMDALAGSSSTLQRSSEAVLRGQNGSIVDSNFKADGLNPDSYFSPGMKGADTRSSGDRVADSIHGLGNRFRNNEAPRHRGFL
ncbi:hypothetical protein [Bacillus sp. FJAT-29937]|uniref:hypothetical protein n=1 Tax=Bacillus sp. FJAT-29937 TaxID=1720553 RepID=UPI00082ED72B|nr:hypothetical protein [Bacillus sp. FJAT-29937]